MNIGIVSVWGEQGEGVVSKQYYNKLDKSHNIFVYVRGHQKAYINDSGYNLYVGSKKTEFKPKAINKSDFKKWIDNNNIELILFNEQQWWPPVLWCKKWGVKTVAYVDYYTEQTIPFFEIYDMLICNTLKHFNTFNWHSNAKYYKWGTELDLYKPVERDIDEVIFFHSCGFSPIRKGTDLLLEAFYNSDQKGKLIIHSQIDLKELLPNSLDIINALESNYKLEIINKTVGSPGLYSIGDVYIYPTRLEGIGLSIAEAQSSGLFTIVSDNSPMNEFVLNSNLSRIKVDKVFARYDGYYHPQVSIDVNDLTFKINYLANDKKLVNQLKKESRTFAEAELDFNVNMSQLSLDLQKIKFKPIKDQSEQKILFYELNRPLSHRKLIVLYNKYVSKCFTVFRKIGLLLSGK